MDANGGYSIGRGMKGCFVQIFVVSIVSRILNFVVFLSIVA